MSEYRVKQPGDVLHLDEDLQYCPAGDYVLMSVGEICCVSRLGENEDGDLCTTNRLVDVPIADLCLFVSIDLNIGLLP